MGWWRDLLRRGRSPDSTEDRRQNLIDRKHTTMGEIRMLQREIENMRRRGADVAAQRSRLERLQSEHYRLRMEIDRTR